MTTFILSTLFYTKNDFSSNFSGLNNIFLDKSLSIVAKYVIFVLQNNIN